MQNEKSPDPSFVEKENTFVCLFLYLNKVEHMHSLRNGKRTACNYRVMDARGC